MPILDREPDLYPENLLQQPAADGVWWAMYTLPRRDKDLMRRLFSKNIGFYAPVFEQSYRSPAGRLRTSFLPLFPNYVFVHGSEADRYAAVATGCVSRCLEVTDQIALVSDLRNVQQLLNSGLDVTSEAQLIPGQLVRVKNGPLTGQIGCVIERRGRQRLFVHVNFLQQGASVEVDGFDLEPWN